MTFLSPRTAGASGMTNGCVCGNRDGWSVTHRRHNHSAFNGWRRAESAYSQVVCSTCSRCWRTKAGYVKGLPGVDCALRTGGTEKTPSPKEWARAEQCATPAQRRCSKCGDSLHVIRDCPKLWGY